MMKYIMYNKWDCIKLRFIKNIRNKALDKIYKILILYLEKIKKKKLNRKLITNKYNISCSSSCGGS